MSTQIVYLLCAALFAIGLYGVATKKNVVKIVISAGVMEYAVNLFIVLGGYRTAGSVPIADAGTDAIAFVGGTVDPLPQALVLTSIVIGLGVTALQLAVCLRLYERYGTFDVTEMRRLRG